MNLIAYCDGSIQGGNPGGRGVGGWCLFEDEQDAGCLTLLQSGCHDLGESPDMTNNKAEYAAVYGALWYVYLKYPDTPVTVKTDSKLVVMQLRGDWRCANKDLMQFRTSVLDVAARIRSPVAYEWVPRNENKWADEISKYFNKPEKVPTGMKPTWITRNCV